jgi:tRNA-splicing ligase RtcB
MSFYNELGGSQHPIKAWTNHVNIDDSAIEQLKQMADLPFIFKHIAAMPDVHVGAGATVGSVIPTINAVIPAAVGVDIGCGMCAVQLSLKAHQLPDNLYKIRRAIEKKVPVGMESHSDKGDLYKSNYKTLQTLMGGFHDLQNRHQGLVKVAKQPEKNMVKQLGTLGGGNHFIELCIDENQNVWVMLHSGSRGIGNQIGRYFIELAKKDMARNNIHLPNEDLAYLTDDSEHYENYIRAVSWAQEYARLNRKKMLEFTLLALQKTLPQFTIIKEAINCHHNYISSEKHYGAEVMVTRKGAVSAHAGQYGIIPGSMGHKSYIVKGKGNKESFCSCSHGAGRLMSRSKAKKTFSLKEHEKATEGVECRKDKGVLDETPNAYKNIDDVMKSQSDLVEIVHTLKQVVCIKG